MKLLMQFDDGLTFIVNWLEVRYTTNGHVLYIAHQEGTRYEMKPLPTSWMPA